MGAGWFPYLVSMSSRSVISASLPHLKPRFVCLITLSLHQTIWKIRTRKQYVCAAGALIFYSSTQQFTILHSPTFRSTITLPFNHTIIYNLLCKYNIQHSLHTDAKLNSGYQHTVTGHKFGRSPAVTDHTYRGSHRCPCVIPWIRVLYDVQRVTCNPCFQISYVYL